MTLINPQPPTMHPIPPIRRMVCVRSMGAMRLMGGQTTAALDAESVEVLANIKALP